MPFQIIRNDITKVKADAIVNTANPRVAVGGGVDTAIYNAAGRDKLLAARAGIGELKPGQVGITPAFNLPARYIIHASGPKWIDGNQGEKELLSQCYEKSLEMAADHKCKSIAFPLMATGVYGFPKEIGLEIAIDAFTIFLEDHDIEITLVVFGSDAVNISGSLFGDIPVEIDDEYAETALADEYMPDYGGRLQRGNMPTGGNRPDKHEPAFFATGWVKSGPIESGRKKQAKATPDEDLVFTASEPIESGAETPQSLEDSLKKICTDSFSKHLQQLINKKGFKNSEVYATANISKQYFSKLLSGKVNPSKEKVMALAVGLHLNMDETVDFLSLAGYSLSPISQTDVVVRYFIERKDYNVMKIDIALFEFGLDPLSKAQ